MATDIVIYNDSAESALSEEKMMMQQTEIKAHDAKVLRYVGRERMKRILTGDCVRVESKRRQVRRELYLWAAARNIPCRKVVNRSVSRQVKVKEETDGRGPPFYYHPVIHVPLTFVEFNPLPD